MSNANTNHGLEPFPGDDHYVVDRFGNKMSNPSNWQADGSFEGEDMDDLADDNWNEKMQEMCDTLKSLPWNVDKGVSGGDKGMTEVIKAIKPEDGSWGDMMKEVMDDYFIGEEEEPEAEEDWEDENLDGEGDITEDTDPSTYMSDPEMIARRLKGDSEE